MERGCVYETYATADVRIIEVRNFLKFIEWANYIRHCQENVKAFFQFSCWHNLPDFRPNFLNNSLNIISNVTDNNDIWTTTSHWQ